MNAPLATVRDEASGPFNRSLELETGKCVYGASLRDARLEIATG